MKIDIYNVFFKKVLKTYFKNKGKLANCVRLY
jgi:hypothetical protein